MYKKDRTGCRLSIDKRIIAIIVAMALLCANTFVEVSASVYVGTVDTPMTYPAVIYWNGANFYSDEACTNSNSIIVDSSENPITQLSELVTAVDAQISVYMKTSYIVSSNESINGGTHTVALKRHSTNTASTLISVNDGGSLTLANITIDGENINATDTAVLVQTGGNLTIGNGTVIQNNHLRLTADNSDLRGGGGVRVCGTATMSGGTIQNNKVRWGGTFGYGGGGVAVVGGSFTMDGGSITYNEALKIGGDGPGGGGVMLAEEATFTMNDGSIDNNFSMYGGAVYNFGKNAIINGGTISTNTAEKSCGGIYCAGSNNLTINGGLIIYNECQASDDSNGLGGAVNINNGNLIITGGSIMGNISLEGDAIFIQNRTSVVISGGSISGSVYSKVDTIYTNGTPGVVLTATVVVIPGISSITKLDSINIKNDDDTSYTFGNEGLYTDATGQLYLWIPADCTVESAVIDGTTIDIGTSTTTITATLSYSSLIAGSMLNAVLTNGTATAWSWMVSDNGVDNWEALSGSVANSYTTTASNVGKYIKVVITDSNLNSYDSNIVQIAANSPTYTITIPESISMSVADSFSIYGNLSNLLSGQSVIVTVNSAGGFKLTGDGDISIDYALYTDIEHDHQITAVNNTVATFNDIGASSDLIYYCITSPSSVIYSGTYSDRLTFTVSLNTGS